MSAMQEIPLKELRAGTVLKDYLLYDKNFIVFSKHGVITQKEIDRAQQYGISPLYASQGLYVVEESGAPPPERHKEMSSKQPYEVIALSLHDIFTHIRKRERIQQESIQKVASLVAKYSMNNRDNALLRVSRGMQQYRLEAHSLNTGVLCTLLAARLNLEENNLINAIAGALFHDVGILLLNENKKDEDVNNHTLYGFKYLKTIKDASPLLVLPAYEHHEKADGNGYPSSLMLKDINPVSKIVAICDSCDTQASYIRFGSDLSLHTTKDELLSWKKEDFDLSLFTQFITVVQEAFIKERPIALNDETTGVVKKGSIRFPLHPVVQILKDAKGEDLAAPATVELVRRSNVWIERFL